MIWGLSIILLRGLWVILTGNFHYVVLGVEMNP